MRHRKGGSKLGKQPAHRRAVLRNLVTNVIVNERVNTTVTRAKAARPLVEKMITLGKRDTLHARRQAAAFLMTDEATRKLFREVAPRFAQRNGGYTRIVRTGFRLGDGASLAVIELLGSELKIREKKERKKEEAAAPQAREQKETSAST
jgi:large subunit ribosomal protein L17